MVREWILGVYLLLLSLSIAFSATDGKIRDGYDAEGRWKVLRG
jgi:hypothetical protein